MSVASFLWGSGGRRMTPDEIARERAMAARRMQTDYSPIQSPWQGLARVADNLMGAIEARRADSASTRNAEDQRRIIEALMNPTPSPSSAPVLPSTGRPMLQNPDGTVSTEESITITDPRINNGSPTNIPSIWGGRRTSSQDEAIGEAVRSGQQFQAFPSIDEAVSAARARSAQLGREVDSLGARPGGMGQVSSVVAGLSDAQPASLTRPSINPAIIEALTSPYVSDEVRALAGRQYTEATRRLEPLVVNGHVLDPRDPTREIADYSTDAQPEIVRLVRATGIDPDTPTGQEMIRRYTENRSDPIVSIPLPNGRTYVGPRSQLPASIRNLGAGAGEPPETLPPDFDFNEGGPTPDASGGFRGGGAPVADAASLARHLFPGIRVTDNRRDPSSRLGRANPDSWHVRSGGAVDVAPIRGMSFAQYVQRYRDAGYRIIEARDEVNHPSRHATGPHWHVVVGM